MAEGKVRQHQAYQAVDSPDMKAPVEESNLHGLLGRIDGFSSAGRRRGVMQHRLGHAKEQQRDTVAGREQHGKPFREGVLGFRVVRPQFDIAPLGCTHRDNKDQEDGNRQHVEPAEGIGNPGQGRAERFPCQLGIADGSDHQQQRNNNGRNKDRYEDSGTDSFRI